jgi:hypothetical protein
VQTVLPHLGFAVRLSEGEVARLAVDPEIALVRADPASWVIRIWSSDPAVVEARTRELERLLKVTSDERYNTPILRGFAAVLGSSQLALLGEQPDVAVSPDPASYIVFYVNGTDVDARTNELERAYGFKSSFRFYGLIGFAAELNKSQLGGLATESGIHMMGTSLGGLFPASRANCQRSSPALRRQLRAVFVRAHPELAGKRLRGPNRVRFASNVQEMPFFGARAAASTPSHYALATFSHPRLAAQTQPEAFLSVSATGLRWRDLAATNGTVCLKDGEGLIPLTVLRAWLLPQSETPSCYRTD